MSHGVPSTEYRVPSLSAREAAVVRELARRPGVPTTIYELADACEWPDDAWERKSAGHHMPKACDYTYNVLQSLKEKFGRDILVNVPRQGYMLRAGALEAGQ